MSREQPMEKTVNEGGPSADTDAWLTQTRSLDVHGWQPIETKPRDHFPVLVWGPYGHHVAFWDVTWTWWSPGSEDPLDWAPTHWMELPERPAQS